MSEAEHVSLQGTRLLTALGILQLLRRLLDGNSPIDANDRAFALEAIDTAVLALDQAITEVRKAKVA